ncbi:MAG: low molecular weight protein arginine phosphatase [Methanobacteriaceae archaeon]|jgi:protein-tyrosine-phosphatase|nr:low molecular weight protein arginine phosphatase [Candidatus Methanorudis spinitermitis]
MVKKVLFVCTGNICRSPMAEAIFNFKASDDFQAISAGVLEDDGYKASNHAITVLKSKNIDLSNHRSQIVDNNLLKSVDYVCCMGDIHITFLKKNYPKYKDKYFKLSDEDIFDPFRYDIDIYEEVANEIENKIDELLEKISI